MQEYINQTIDWLANTDSNMWIALIILAIIIIVAVISEKIAYAYVSTHQKTLDRSNEPELSPIPSKAYYESRPPVAANNILPMPPSLPATINQVDKTCSTCSFWDTDNWHHEDNDFRRCHAMLMRKYIVPLDDYEFDKEESYKAYRKEELGKAKAYVADASDYSASFITGPNFSCIKHNKAG